MPYLTKSEIESIAARVFRSYQKLFLHQGGLPSKVEPKILAEKLLGLTVLYRKLAAPSDVLGLTSPGEVYVAVVGDDGKLSYEHIDGRTIIVNASLLDEPSQIGHLHFTLMHEASHQIYKMLFPKAYACEGTPSVIHYCRRPSRQRQTNWEEWRTDALAAAILMPPELIRLHLRQFVHIAAASGRWCGAKRPRSGGSGRSQVKLK